MKQPEQNIARNAHKHNVFRVSGKIGCAKNVFLEIAKHHLCMKGGKGQVRHIIRLAKVTFLLLQKTRKHQKIEVSASTSKNPFFDEEGVFEKGPPKVCLLSVIH